VLRVVDWQPLNAAPPHGSSVQYEFAWRPDGKGLIALINQNLWCFQLSNNEWMHIGNGEHNYRPPVRWSPDGRSILLWDYDTFGCVVVDASGDKAATTRSFAGVPFNDYDWAVDGKSIWIATAKDDLPKTKEKNHQTDGVYQAYLDGRPRNLVWSIEDVRWVIASPNGRYLACVVGGKSTECLRHSSAIWVFDTDTIEPIEVDTEGAPYPFLSWSPDSRRLAYSKSNHCAIWDVDAKRRRHQSTEEGIWIPFFHPITGHLWGQVGGALYELEDGKWSIRHTLAERLELLDSDSLESP
jgi:Tol biopolymer transport system component